MLCMSEYFGKDSLGKKLCLFSLQQCISDYFSSVTYKDLSALPSLTGNRTPVVLASQKKKKPKKTFTSHVYGKLFGRAIRTMDYGQCSYFYVAAASLSSAGLRGLLQPEREIDLVFSLISESINRVTVSIPDLLYSLPGLLWMEFKLLSYQKLLPLRILLVSDKADVVERNHFILHWARKISNDE